MPQPIVRHIALRAVQGAIVAAGIFIIMMIFSRQAHAATTSSPTIPSAATSAVSGATSAASPATLTAETNASGTPAAGVGSAANDATRLMGGTLGVDSGYSALWPWFLLIGIALGLVVVASSEAIVGNAPVERGGGAVPGAGDHRQTSTRMDPEGHVELEKLIPIGTRPAPTGTLNPATLRALTASLTQITVAPRRDVECSRR